MDSSINARKSIWKDLTNKKYLKYGLTRFLETALIWGMVLAIYHIFIEGSVIPSGR